MTAGPASEQTAAPVAREAGVRRSLNDLRETNEHGEIRLRLDELFDHGAVREDLLPKARVILGRAEKTGVAKNALARAIGSARTRQEAAAALASLGVLRPNEYRPARDALGFKFVLLRLWNETSEIPSAAIDARSPVPALIADKDGVTYHIHGVAHGEIRLAARGRVLALVRSLEKAGLPLYSEQKFPKAYGYAHGKEILNHPSFEDAPARLAQASATAGSPAARLLRRAFELAVAPGSLVLPLAALAGDAADARAWIALGALALFNWAVLTSFLPIQRWLQRRYARQAETELQDEDMAHHSRAYAELAQRSTTTVADVFKVELPMPLQAEEGGAATLRSKAMARAIARDAAQAGHKEVHVLAGINHAQELAWYLKQEA